MRRGEHHFVQPTVAEERRAIALHRAGRHVAPSRTRQCHHRAAQDQDEQGHDRQAPAESSPALGLEGGDPRRFLGEGAQHQAEEFAQADVADAQAAEQGERRGGIGGEGHRKSTRQGESQGPEQQEARGRWRGGQLTEELLRAADRVGGFEQRGGRGGDQQPDATERDAPGQEAAEVRPPESGNGTTLQRLAGDECGHRAPRRDDGGEQHSGDEQAGPGAKHGPTALARQRDTKDDQRRSRQQEDQPGV